MIPHTELITTFFIAVFVAMAVTLWTVATIHIFGFVTVFVPGWLAAIIWGIIYLTPR
jgi:hypothetical protein